VRHICVLNQFGDIDRTKQILISRHRKPSFRGRLRKAVRSSTGAIDLASIMVGVIVVGAVAGTIAATVFAVIPWSQDAAAKQDLRAVQTAQSVQLAMSTGASGGYRTPVALASFGAEVQASAQGGYLDYAGLVGAGLVQETSSVAVSVSADRSCYVAVAASSTGDVFLATNSGPDILNYALGAETGCVDGNALTALVGLVSSSAGGAGPDVSSILTMTIDTSIANCKAFTLPIQNDAASAVPTNFTVNWGDGSAVETVTSNLKTHTYTATGTQTITADGTFGRLGNNAGIGSTSCITGVTGWGAGTKSTSAQSAFFSAPVTTVAAPPSSVTNMSVMFNSSTAFNESVSSWNTGNVTDMSNMFRNSMMFNQPLGSWDTSNVTDMRLMFAEKSVYNQPLGSWDTSNVINMTQMFSDNTAFDQDLTAWNVTKVTLFQGFHTRSVLTPINVPEKLW
jgi:surface protein